MNHPFDTRNPQRALVREIHPQASLPPEADQAPPNTLDFRSSDQTLDRYQEVFAVAGWKLDNYRKNPVVQNAHNYWSLADTIGKSLITEVRGASDRSAQERGLQSAAMPGPYLFQRVQFAVEENTMA